MRKEMVEMIMHYYLNKSEIWKLNLLILWTLHTSIQNIENEVTRFNKIKNWIRENFGTTAIFSLMVIAITGLIIKSRDTIRAALHTAYKDRKMLAKLATVMGKILEPVLKVLSKVLSWIGDLLGWISENLWVVPLLFGNV